MATFTMNVTDTVPKSGQPYLVASSLTDDSCETRATIFVPVPVGQSRYVDITYIGGGSSSTSTISADDTFTLLLNFGLRSTTTSLNTNFTLAVINVRLTAGSSIFYSYQITRTDTGVPC